jgi:uncharacterized protein (TIGR02246 family)
MKPIKTTTPLPDAVTRYLDAANRFDSEAAADCFTPEATVLDEGKTHTGPAAIQEWMRQTGEQYAPEVSVISAQPSGDEIAVVTQVAGNFPGSPVELCFRFELAQGKINRLSIQ